MNNPERHRAQALLALALRIRHAEPAYAGYLMERVEELEAQATAIEEAAEPPSAADALRPPRLQ